MFKEVYQSGSYDLPGFMLEEALLSYIKIVAKSKTGLH